MEFPELSEIKSKIPAEYFKSSLPLSLYYVVRSAIFVVALAYITYFTLARIDESHTQLRAAIYVAYWYIQGILFWGIFVLGHDCGHGSFSRYPKINQIFGNILHSFLLVPYEPWKTTHRLHHKNTGNIDKDEIFYPQRGGHSVYNDARRIIVVFLAGAWITYLYINVKRHFWVFEDIYEGIRIPTLISHLSWAAFAYLLYLTYLEVGFHLLAVYYFVPLLVFMSWLVITTFLHHQDIDAPWYGNANWTYVKGNISSVDRSYGYVVDNLIHNIGTHQIHHLFPIIPHYKLVDSTSYFRKAFPQFVKKNDENIVIGFIKNYYYYVKYAVVDSEEQNYTFSYRELIEKYTPSSSSSSTAQTKAKSS